MALFNSALITILVYHDDASAWWYLQPALVFVATVVLCATRNWLVALLMLAYAVLVILNLLATIVVAMFNAGTSLDLMKQLEPMHRAIEFAHLYVLGAGVKALEAARASRRRAP